ncbi:radical SAM protein [Butyrivibrio sp. VCD2006]|uniref:radical SAM protein n=1 Tax=Butyrivibrio sp. VCD2006 TaxID=1280664 RepID=UPI00041BA909|nr:radical SAM protein [Butyrivibrio sp. VCD2006]
MKSFTNKFFIFGTRSNWFDLSFVFDDLDLSIWTTDIAELEELIQKSMTAVLCCDEKHVLKKELTDKYGDGCCLIDDELIEELNYPLREKIKGKKVYIWGTGWWCDRLLEWLDKDIIIEGFIDNALDKQGTKKNGKPIVSPSELKVDDCFVIVAVQNFTFVEIEKQMQSIGINESSYVSAGTVMDDVACLFRRVYKNKSYYPVECKNLDENIRIAYNGNVCSCCLAYESVYGNILTESFSSIWKSNRAKVSRLSLANQTYVFCDKDRCAYLNGIEPLKECNHLRNVPIYEREYPVSIAPEIDYSCNLYCNSCRKETYTDLTKEREVFTDTVLNKIVPLPTKLVINTVGEPFASKNCLRIIHDETTRRKGSIAIYTNGILLTPDKLDQLLEEYVTIDIAVSIDAATQSTYEKIRRGGDFNKLCTNLNYLREKKEEGRITFFRVSFTVQTINAHEMQDFVYMAEKMGADKIGFNHIENWGIYSKDEFEKLTIIDGLGIKEEYKKYFTDEVINNSNVNVFNFSNLLGLEPKKMDYLH